MSIKLKSVLLEKNVIKRIVHFIIMIKIKGNIIYLKLEVNIIFINVIGKNSINTNLRT